MLRTTPVCLKNSLFRGVCNRTSYFVKESRFSFQQKTSQAYRNTKSYFLDLRDSIQKNITTTRLSIKNKTQARVQATQRTISAILYGSEESKQPTLLLGDGKAVVPELSQDPSFAQAVRFAETDVNFARVDPLLREIEDEQNRLTLAKHEVNTISGITDSLNFVRNRLPKYDLGEENTNEILGLLDQQSHGMASDAYKTLFK